MLFTTKDYEMITPNNIEKHIFMSVRESLRRVINGSVVNYYSIFPAFIGKVGTQSVELISSWRNTYKNEYFLTTTTDKKIISTSYKNILDIRFDKFNDIDKFYIKPDCNYYTYGDYSDKNTLSYDRLDEIKQEFIDIVIKQLQTSTIIVPLVLPKTKAIVI